MKETLRYPATSSLNSCDQDGTVSQGGVCGGGEGLGWGQKRMSSILDMLHLNQKLVEYFILEAHTYVCV